MILTSSTTDLLEILSETSDSMQAPRICGGKSKHLSSILPIPKKNFLRASKALINIIISFFRIVKEPRKSIYFKAKNGFVFYAFNIRLKMRLVNPYFLFFLLLIMTTEKRLCYSRFLFFIITSNIFILSRPQ